MAGFDADGIVFEDGEGGLLEPPGDLHVAGYLPLLVNAKWVNAVLLNDAEQEVDAWALYRDERQAARVGYKTWSNRYPNGAPTVDAMPMANVATTWGDYLVLGDIVWKEDASEGLDEENAARHPHGLWFSEPGTMDSWDPLEVQFVGQRSGGNRIVGLFPMEAGLLVASTSGLTLLHGTASDHESVDLRVGVGPRGPGAVTYWAQTGSVIWLDARNQVWQTNGEGFSRIDQPLPDAEVVQSDMPQPPGSVAAWDNYLVVVRGERTFVLRAEHGAGAWTELNAEALAEVVGYRGSVWGRSADGVVRFAPSLLSQRGHRDGVPVESEVATRTLDGSDPHEVTFWHRFGARTSGGTIKRAWAKTGPALTDAAEVSHDTAVSSDERDLRVWPSHGPSVEASFGMLAEGNITFESFTVWAHKGRGSR